MRFEYPPAQGKKGRVNRRPLLVFQITILPNVEDASKNDIAGQDAEPDLRYRLSMWYYLMSGARNKSL